MIIGSVFITCEAVLRIDINFPRKVCRGAVEFLIKEVSPTSDRLSKRQAWSRNIRPLSEVESMSARVEEEHNRSANYGTGNPQPTFTQIQCIQWMCEIPAWSNSSGGCWGQNM